MTATGTPDDDHEVERPEPGQPAQAPPPPPQWLDDQRAASAPLLPEYGAEEEDEPGREAASSGASEGGASEGGAFDSGVNEAMHTVVLGGHTVPPSTSPSQEDASEGDVTRQISPGGRPAPANVPPRTSTDIPAPPPFPYGQQIPGTQEPPEPPAPRETPEPQGLPDATQVETPAPPPFPYAQEMPDATRAEPFPAPPAQQPPAPPQPTPGYPPPPVSPSQSPPAHEPFPYAQEIPSGPAPAAHEPFPYAQEIPGTPPGPPAAEQFPWAQQIPGGGHPGQPMQPGPGAVQPITPPPAIEEPWRTQGGSTRSRRNVKKPLLIGVAVLAVAGLAAAGVLVVPGLLEGDDEGGGDGAKLAASLFPVAGSAKTDGRDQEILGVAAAGSTVVAVGGESDPQTTRGMFLVSTDGGGTFTSAKVAGRDDGGPAATAVPRAVGGSSQGWIAIGSGRPGGAVWTSPDGKTWTPQPDAVGRVFGPGNRVTQIAATGSGFIAIGMNSRKGDFSDAQAAVWSSADGRQWETRVGDDIGLEVTKASYALTEIASSDNVVLLKALVKPDNKKPPQYRKVWQSQDGGRTWAVSEVPVPKGSRGLSIGGGEAGFLAIREMKGKDAFYGQAFVSKDGKAWTGAGKLETNGYSYTGRILGNQQGYTALVHGGGNLTVSHSADGNAWKPAGTAPGKPGLQVESAAPAGDRTVLVGHQPGGGDRDPLLSVYDGSGRAVPVDPAKIPGAVRPDHAVRAVGTSGTTAVAVGSAAGDAAAWTSADGSSWKPAQGLGAAFTRPGPQRLLDVAGGKAGWLAVGYDQAVPRRPLVVTSQDGSTWQGADATEAFQDGRKGALVTNAAASAPAGYVVVGAEGPSAAAWFSTDLKTWRRGTSADPNAMLGKPRADRRMLDVAGGTAGFTAAGAIVDARGDHPAVWSSSDGRAWALKALPLPAGATQGQLTHVAAKGGTLAAAGVASTPQGPAWIGYVSTDGGKLWREVPAPGGGKQVVATALTATENGFAATGATGGSGSADVVSMTSPDGSNWTTEKPGGEGLTGDGEQQITGLAALGTKLLGVGQSTGTESTQPVLWTRSS
ncbi:hypothetical protein [Actinomadura sp. 9N215]|uniref:hypothetical protein n=1 Tax=Actinomadura sp. 9N215 TaxID=3375150 RepID=UPI0037A9B1AF